MTATTLRRRQNVTFKEVRAALRDVAERQKETDRLMKETDRRQKRLDKQMGLLHNRFGEMAEHLVAPGIHKRFNALGYTFDALRSRGTKIFGEDGKCRAEIDILLENGDIVMAVEVKAKPAESDVEEYIEKLEILRDYYRKKNDNRKIQGAIAGAVFGEAQKRATVQAGLYVIEQSGDTMKIDVPDGFVPREW